MKLEFECGMRWDQLVGSGSRRRHCTECNEPVYNLSGMSKQQAKAFVGSKKGQGRVCVRFAQHDGVIIHGGDPYAQLREQRRGAARLLAGALAVQTVIAVAIDTPFDYFADPFAVIPLQVAESVEEMEQKFESAQMSAHSGGIMF